MALPVAATAPPAELAWQPVVDGFTADFTDPGAGHADWLARISRWTTTDLATQHALTAPERIPVAALRQLTLLSVGDDVVDVLAEYDNDLTLVIRAQASPQGWQITAVQPATSTP